MDKKVLNNENQEPAAKETDYLISIKERGGKFKELTYQKTEQGLNLFLKSANGNIKPQDIIVKKISHSVEGINGKAPELITLNKKVLNRAAAKSAEDVLIALGVPAMEEAEKFLQEPSSPIINIDIDPFNKKYGEANLIDENSASFSEIVFDLLCELDENPLNEQAANSLLAGIVYASKNLQSPKLNSASFNKINRLIDCGASMPGVRQALYGSLEKNSLAIFAKILNKLKIYPVKSAKGGAEQFDKVNPEKQLAIATISINDFKQTCSSPSNLGFALRKLTSGLFPFNNLLLLWEQNSSPLYVRGVFYSPQKDLMDKLASQFESQQKGDALLFKTTEKNLEMAREKALRALE